MAAPSCVIQVVKEFSYRGQPEQYANTYALSGPTPADTTAWRALFDALKLQERTLYTNLVSIVHGYGWNRLPEKGDHALWSVDLKVSPNSVDAGTYNNLTQRWTPGDGAAWIRWGLDRFTNPGGKRIYLRKYFHPAYLASTPDQIEAGWQTAASAFAQKLQDGSFLDARKLVDKDGNIPIGHAVSTYATTRTLKRRGKRPAS